MEGDLAGSKPYYFGFTGMIEPSSVSRICGALNTAFNDGATEIHLAFNSSGGLVADGIYLYNHIRALPTRTIIYNTGTVASIAVAIYVAASERYCSEHGVFMIHPTVFPQLAEANAEKLRAFYGSALADDERTDAILRERTGLSDELLSSRRYSDVWITQREAVKQGVAHELREFTVPQGFQVFQI